MQHSKPSFLARSLTLRNAEALPGKACLQKTGLNQASQTAGVERGLNCKKILRNLIERNAEVDQACFSERYTAAERLQLSETAQNLLDEEILLLRRGLRSFIQLTQRGGNEPGLNEAAKALDLCGRICSRIASIVKINVSLQAGNESELAAQLLKAVDLVSFEPLPETEEKSGSRQ